MNKQIKKTKKTISANNEALTQSPEVTTDGEVPPVKTEETAANPVAQMIKRKEKARKNFVSELNYLATDLDVIIEKVLLRIKSRIMDLAGLFEQNNEFGQKIKLPSAKVINQMIIKLSNFKTKPQKGRIKDLIRIEQILDEIIEKLPKNK